MLQHDFNFMINEFGVPVKLNDETNTRKVLLSSRGISKIETNFDDRIIHTNFPIKRGDTMKYNDVIYLVYSDVQAKKGFEYQSLIRPMTNTFTFTYLTEGVIDHYDELDNPVYVPGHEPREVIEKLPCIAYQEGNPTLSSGKIILPETRIKVIMPDNNMTEQIKMNTTHTVINHTYNIVDINLLQKGIRIFTMDWAI
ncbi:hypothetical protein KGF86_06900 [Ornithinibacillus massiliensis]|uniref:Uncharacterized protein n=1 Tax=Ornithinibacillus massiliensis TaxID=1944633 RepID=A0ABS5MCA5_9BACI|nr:hypothetical protein [Ornithinibacillus massiliensis]MBS3679935.1 hypothetical protein [Ornithinibacillus massiliensis]